MSVEIDTTVIRATFGSGGQFYDQFLWPVIRDLCHALDEERSEISRHHEDFERIRAILDNAPPGTGEIVKDLRNIVG